VPTGELPTRDDTSVAVGLTFRPILLRFTLAGALAGALAGLWSLLVTERAIDPALAIEESRSHGGDEHSVEIFSRGVQVTGGVLGSVIAGVVIGLLFAVVFAAVRHRLPARTDFGRAAVLGAIGFGVLALLPAVAMPANPPAVGDPATIGRRTAIYGGVLAAGLVIALLTSALVSALESRGFDRPVTVLIAVLTAGVLVGLVLVFFPRNPDVIPADVPAALLWNFRLASLGQLAVLWSTVALVGGTLVDRLTRGAPARV
jgi:predicted cobalt transporter CbtA